MEIQPFPPRRMWRVMAIRADSICRLVTYAGSSAWMAYSPKLIWVPPLARPERLGWCCLRCLTRRGISTVSDPLLGRRGGVLRGRVLGRSGGLGAGGVGDRLLASGLTGGRGHRAVGGVDGRAGRGFGGGAAGLGPTGGGARGARAARPLRALAALLPGGEGLEGLPLGTRAAGVALVDPDLHADAAEGGPGLVDAVVDVRPEGVQRHAALAVELRPAHLGAAQATGALHPDALDLRAALGRLHGLAHGAAEADPAGELLGDALGDQLRVGLGVLHLEDVQLHLLAGELLQLAADAVGLGAAAADDDPGAGGVDVHADAVTGALDVHLGDAGALEALGHHPADLDVLADVVLVELVREPAALPVGGDAEAEPGGG